MIDFYMYDDIEDSNARFVGFVGNHGRYDLVILNSTRFFGKSLVMNMQTNKFSVMGTDDLDEDGYVEYALGLNSEEEAIEVEEFLREVLIPGYHMGDS